MTNSERYHAAFSHLHAPADAARRAQEALEGPAPAPVRRRWRRPLAVAAAVVLLLAGVLGAEASSGEISNLLAPIYGVNQTALADRIGIPLDASVSCNGYTLTAEAVLGDRYHFMVVYTLTRDDGEPIPQGATVSEWRPEFFGSAGGDLQIVREGLPENQMRILESYGGRASVLGRHYTVTMKDLVRYEGENYEEQILLAEGEWTLRFALRYRDSTVKVPLHDTVVDGKSGETYVLHELWISPIGLNVALTAPTAMRDELGSLSTGNMRPVLRLKDGTELEMCRSGSTGSWRSGDETYEAHLEGQFSTIVPLEDMEAVIFNDVEIPLDLT